MKIKDRFEGCIIGGAIGDAFGSMYENQASGRNNAHVFYPFGKPQSTLRVTWQLTDDTQLTLATCEAITETKGVHAQAVAERFLSYYKARKLTGLGASTLKALQELAVGGHWSQVGRKGEFAAGNGAAMRIAPIAFVYSALDKRAIENVSRITHHNDEAYAGALAVAVAIKLVISGKCNLLTMVAQNLPDTKVKDRIVELAKIQTSSTIHEVGKQYGNSGYVVESVPLAIFAASKVDQIGFKEMLTALASIGGDTDTNCSMAGQIAGTLIGIHAIPADLKMQLMNLREYKWIKETIDNFAATIGWHD
jgi:ADP-ribosyl-[dinitrogen reductase] hydrolase